MKSNKNKLDQIISLKITNEIKNELDVLASNNHQTRSSLIRLILCKEIGKPIPKQTTWARTTWLSELTKQFRD